jgi:hypothetical protein
VRPRRETSMHYFSCLAGTGTDMIKSTPGIRYAELMILHPVGYVGHVVHSGASWA